MSVVPGGPPAGTDPASRGGAGRRALPPAFLLALALLAPVSPAGPQKVPRGAVPETSAVRHPDLTPELIRAVNRGLEFLASVQEDDGAFGPARARIAITALGSLAFMAGGHTEGRGRYRRQVGRALKYLLDHVDRSDPASPQHGFIRAPEDALSRMHGHGYALLALAEALGMTAADSPLRGRLREAVTLATRLAERTQELRHGGWYYYPERDQHEGSVTICILQGLRAARNAGIKVDKGVIDRAVDYVRKSQAGSGGFRYQVQHERVTFALTAAAVSTLNAAGEYDDVAIHRGLDFMDAGWRDHLTGGDYYYYAGFYAAQAFYHAPPRRGAWERYWPELRDDLLRRQDLQTGRFECLSASIEDHGPEYATAMALLMLQMPFQYLPIFQR